MFQHARMLAIALAYLQSTFNMDGVVGLDRACAARLELDGRYEPRREIATRMAIRSVTQIQWSVISFVTWD
jgi:hypothetical protein